MVEAIGYAEILAVTGLGGIIGLVSARFGYPTVVGYIIAGIIYGYIFGIDSHDPVFLALGSLGITLLSFNIGIETRLDFIRSYAKEIFATVSMDFLITFLIWRMLSYFLEINSIQTLLLTVIVICASSGVIFKMLAIGRGFSKEFKMLIYTMLAVQDIIIIVALTLVNTPIVGNINLYPILLIISKLVVFAVVSFIVGKRITSWLLKIASRHNLDIYLIIVLTLILGYSFLASYIGLSSLYGAFIAGMIIASLSDPQEMLLRLSGLMELGLLIYFSLVGALVTGVSAYYVVIGMIVGFISILVRMFSFSLSSWAGGFPLRDSIRAGLLMTVISENGLVLASSALIAGYFNNNIYGMITIMILFSFIISAPIHKRSTTLSVSIEKRIPVFIKNVVENVLRKYYRQTSAMIVELSWTFIEGVSLLIILTLFISQVETTLPNEGYYLFLKALMITAGIFVSTIIIHYSMKTMLRKVLSMIKEGIEGIEISDAIRVIVFLLGTTSMIIFIIISVKFALGFYFEEIIALNLPYIIAVLIPITASIMLLLYYAKKTMYFLRDLRKATELHEKIKELQRETQEE